MGQAIDSHQGRERQLVDRLIEKYGNLAWNHFKGIIDNDYSSSTVVPDASYGASSCSAPAAIDIGTVRRVLFDDTLHAGSVLVGLHADQVQARFINVGLIPPDIRFSSLCFHLSSYRRLPRQLTTSLSMDSCWGSLG